MREIAFLSTEDLEEFVVYDELTYGHFEARGCRVSAVPWRAGLDPTHDWSRFELVIIRSPWDYQQDAERFLEVLERIDSATRLENPIDTVRWNLRKSYLRDIEQRGVPIVPTIFRRAGDAVDTALFEKLAAQKIVVKPLVSGNADHTYVLDAATFQDARPRLDEVFSSRDYLAQPFMPSILDEGEYSLFYFGGEYSHAILKTPKSGDFRVQEEHGGRIRGIEADAEMLIGAQRALRAIGRELLYARVDFVRDTQAPPEARFRVMELELIEPSLYFPYAEGSAERFAQVVLSRLQSPA